MRKKELNLNSSQKEILIGYLLSDGCLDPLPTSNKARLKVEQGLKQREFAEWLFSVFKGFTRTPPKEKHYLNSSSKGVFYKHSFCFNTLSFKSLHFFYQMFYQNRKKVVPANLEQLLTPLAFAVWFMGDGSVKSKECNGRILNTQGFSAPEVLNLCEILNKKFNLLVSVRRQKDGMQLYISAKSARVLSSLITPYLLPYFNYKLPKFES